MTCLQNLQLGCSKQKGWEKRGNTENGDLGLQDSLLYLPQTGLHTYLAKMLRQTSQNELISSCRVADLSPSSTWGSPKPFSQPEAAAPVTSTEGWKRGSCCSVPETAKTGGLDLTTTGKLWVDWFTKNPAKPQVYLSRSRPIVSRNKRQ